MLFRSIASKAISYTSEAHSRNDKISPGIGLGQMNTYLTGAITISSSALLGGSLSSTFEDWCFHDNSHFSNSWNWPNIHLVQIRLHRLRTTPWGLFCTHSVHSWPVNRVWYQQLTLSWQAWIGASGSSNRGQPMYGHHTYITKTDATARQSRR